MNVGSIVSAFLFSAVFAAATTSRAAAQMDHSHGMHDSKSMGTTNDAQNKTADKAKPAALKPAEGAKIKILSPTKDQVIKGDKVPVQFQLTKGKRGHHAHAYVDGELMGMFESEKGTLNGIKPGKHVLEMRVVAEDHQTELNATDKVSFTVK